MAFLMFAMLAIPTIVSEPAEGATVNDLSLYVNGTRNTGSQAISAGSYTDFYLILNNTNTTVASTSRLTSSGVGDGFSVQFINESSGLAQSEFVVPASGVHNVTVRVSADTELAGGLTESFTITATDQDRSGIADSSVITVRVSDTFSLLHYMVSTGTTKTYSKWENTTAGETMAFAVWMENKGNTAITVTLSETPALPTNWTYELVSDLVDFTPYTPTTIQPDGIDNYYLLITTSEGDIVGTNASIVIRATVDGGTSVSYSNENLTFYGMVANTIVAPRWTSNVVATNITAGDQTVYETTFRNDNTVAMNYILSIPYPTSGGSVLSGWDVAVYEDDGSTSGEWDEDDTLYAVAGTPSGDNSIVAGGAVTYWVVVNSSSSAVNGTVAVTSALGTFTSLARSGTTLTLTDTVTSGASILPQLTTWQWVAIIVGAILVILVVIIVVVRANK